ncbi:hypothetical protein [uncultured Gammaproteobacteria bacterium]|nr:hypothetical protein [uncultured Gammaproteobacteria bacterium]CAC9959583.1 hypothetical protein [uncultured Gammaproteobacteria bacterium]
MFDATVDTDMPKPNTSDKPKPVTKKSSGGGCVYNSNATGRADMGFILLMVPSVWYLVRRRRNA